jgi:hypothetical protein
MGLNLLLHVEGLIDDVNDTIRAVMFEQYRDRVPPNMMSQLLRYQQERTLTHDKSHRSQDVCLDFDYDFFGYIENGSELERRTRLTFCTKDFQKNLAQKVFFETIFLRRRLRPGLLDVKVDHEVPVEL